MAQMRGTWDDDDSWRDDSETLAPDPTSGITWGQQRPNDQGGYSRDGVTRDGRPVGEVGAPGTTTSPRESFDRTEQRPPQASSTLTPQPTAPPPNVNLRSDSGGGGSQEQPSMGGDSPSPQQSMTPVRPKTPTPAVTQAPTAPVAFEPMEQLASPGSMIQPMNESYSAGQVQQRAPFIPEPVQQYEGMGVNMPSFGRAEGLLGGGIGLPDSGEGIGDPELDELLKALMGGGR